MKNKLAVVMPAYYQKYLGEALESLSLQTNKNFKVYIGDDHSSDNLKNIVEKYKTKIDITYFRFDKNIGQKNLIKQWNRCVRLSNEEWVWLFSDDDLADSNCVEKFYRSIEKSIDKYLVYRFNMRLIDSESEVRDISPPHANIERPIEFILHRLQGSRHGCISNFIFTRDAFDREGGFVNFPAAWYADDASIAAFSKSKSIYTIPGPRISYRVWEGNISSNRDSRKVNALFLYLEWIGKRYVDNDKDANDYLNIINITEKNWIINNIIDLGGVPIKDVLRVSSKLNNRFGISIVKWGITLVFINIYHYLKIMARYTKIQTWGRK